jgi:hypothetical protein
VACVVKRLQQLFAVVPRRPAARYYRRTKAEQKQKKQKQEEQQQKQEAGAGT